MLLVLNLLAFRRGGSSYGHIAALTGTTRSGAKSMIRSMARKGYLQLEENGPGRPNIISTQPILDTALALANGVGPQRQSPPSDADPVHFRWTLDNLHFTRLPALLFESPHLDLTATEIHLILVIFYLTYFSRGHTHNQVIRTSLAEIAELMGVCKATVSRTITSLENKKLVARATQPGQPLCLDFYPLVAALRAGGRVLARMEEHNNVPAYTVADLKEIHAGTPFKAITPEELTSLVSQYGVARVAFYMDALAYQYRKGHIDRPLRLLRKMLPQTLTPQDGFIPWPARKVIQKEDEERKRDQRNRLRIRREFEDYERGKFDGLPPEERERWIQKGITEFPNMVEVYTPEHIGEILYREDFLVPQFCKERNLSLQAVWDIVYGKL